MKAFALSAALLFAAALAGAQETATYRLSVDDKVESYKTVVRKTAGGFEITETQAGGAEERTTLVDDDYRTMSFHYRSEAAGTDYAAVRTGKTIAVTGRLRGRSLRREFAAGDRPWHQALDGALARFAAGPEPRTGSFWFMNADEAEFVEMEAVRESREPVRIGNASVDAWKVRVSLTGFASLFWSAVYWFRTDDSAYVRYETAGGWGSPKIVIELDERGGKQ